MCSGRGAITGGGVASSSSSSSSETGGTAGVSDTVFTFCTAEKKPDSSGPALRYQDQNLPTPHQRNLILTPLLKPTAASELFTVVQPVRNSVGCPLFQLPLSTQSLSSIQSQLGIGKPGYTSPTCLPQSRPRRQACSSFLVYKFYSPH